MKTVYYQIEIKSSQTHSYEKLKVFLLIFRYFILLSVWNCAMEVRAIDYDKGLIK